jgi:hypothetical protein
MILRKGDENCKHRISRVEKGESELNPDYSWSYCEICGYTVLDES